MWQQRNYSAGAWVLLLKSFVGIKEMILKCIFSSGSNVSLRNITALLAETSVFSFFYFFLKNIWNLSLDIMYIVLWLHLQSQEVFIVIAIVVMLRAESVIWTYWRWLYWQKFIVILIVLYNKWFHDIPFFLWLCFPGALKYHLFVDITTTTKKMSQWNLNKQTNKNPSKTLCQRETLRWCWIPSLNFK